ncbi:hypothetical protein EZ428_20895 [Pedobacter frigiditerrae]|uniref:Lipocalin-like domain-containing protein n=1 Tax=Pedobacter frigiditerrae TaxID=2530452 RepID=A0A4R0MPL9_9SPHI|nr:hypothetical protein [Pedobacter frigiditerrae]TCC88182.1 hypothetical protein EZ428_20895 [Pedobacter frigiditerrae]
MSKSKIAPILLAFTALAFYACKKEVLTDKQAALQQLVGRWPLKYKIRTIEDGFGIRKDTTAYNPVDTLVFSADGKYIQTNKTVIKSGTFTLDEAGESITFSGTPALTQKFNYIRTNTIGLVVSDETDATGYVKVRTLTIDELSK